MNGFVIDCRQLCGGINWQGDGSGGHNWGRESRHGRDSVQGAGGAGVYRESSREREGRQETEDGEVLISDRNRGHGRKSFYTNNDLIHRLQ